MKHPRLRIKRSRLAWLLAPPALWALLVTAIPTEWARSRLVTRLSGVTGKSVRLERVRLGMFGGVRLENLEIGEADSLDDPWLRVTNLRVNLHLLNILLGRCQPSKFQANQVSLRIHRRANGSFEFGNLLITLGPHPSASSEAGNEPARSRGLKAEALATVDISPIEFTVHNGQLSLIDEPSRTRLEFTQIESRGSWDSQNAVIEQFRGQLNGGKIALVVQLDRSAESPAFEGQARAEGVALSDGMGVVGYLVPLMSQAPSSGNSRLDMNVYFRGQGSTRKEIRQSLVGQGTVRLEPIQLDGSRAIAELASLFDLPSSVQVGSVSSQFMIGDGRVTSKQLTLNLGQIPFVLSGWTDFDGRLDYRIRSEGLTSKLSVEARSFLAELPIDLDDLLKLRIQGNLDDLAVTVNSPSRSSGSRDDSSRDASDRVRLRELGHRLRDRILR
jgi:AsmA-like C-terminal region